MRGTKGTSLLHTCLGVGTLVLVKYHLQWYPASRDTSSLGRGGPGGGDIPGRPGFGEGCEGLECSKCRCQ
jgi:hypothetical protein